MLFHVSYHLYFNASFAPADLLIIPAAAMVSLRSFLAGVWMAHILTGTSDAMVEFMGFSDRIHVVKRDFMVIS